MDWDEISGLSYDVEGSWMDKLRWAFPQCFDDGELNVERLLSLCGVHIGKDSGFELRWQGKQESMKLAGKRSAGALRPCPEESVEWDNTSNIYIEGDNLEALKLLTKSYRGKVKMICIDPPYNTGNDFVYNDSFLEPLGKYLQSTRQTAKSNPETTGRFHVNWLNMMLPRLMVSAQLLRDDGIIFISIDETEMANLRKLCDEVFGERNHVADFVWRNKKGGGNDAKHVAVEHEYVIMYAKSIDSLGRLFVPYSPEYLKRYKEEDENGRFFWDTLKRKSGKQYYPIVCPDGTVLEKDEHGNPISWLRSEARFKKDLASGEARIEKVHDGWSVQFKQRLPEGKKPRTIFLEESIMLEKGTTSDGSAELLELFSRNVFNNPKPVELIKHLLCFDTSGEDIVMDFFSGSATTAHALMKLNSEDQGKRRFIMVQLPQECDEKTEAAKAGFANICEIGKERIRRAGQKFKNVDTGFRVFKLDTSSFAGSGLLMPGRSELDAAFEIMLKLGFDLCESVRAIELDKGRKAYDIGGKVIAAFSKMTLDEICRLADRKPETMVLSKPAFDCEEDEAKALKALRARGIKLICQS
ncbi:MAG: site-specific DNA-methyltransferase [Clostridiales bacterium]|nr:site-specific DNA-methyltransferase [Clostridiales bacterium]MDR2750905.1 site-specific DNA-methyltransferase [Clostridiales bacterium]